MNRNLSSQVRNRIISKFRRFDNGELVGKVVAKASYDGEVAAIAFTDGTWCAVWPNEDYEGPTLDPNAMFNSLDLYTLKAYGLITEDEFNVARKTEKESTHAYKLKKLRQMQAELGIVDRREPPLSEVEPETF